MFSTFKEPIKIVLGKHRKVCKRKNKKKIVEVEDSFYYVPILQSLQQQLSAPRIFQMVMNAEVQQGQEDAIILTDFSNGTLFNEHPLFSNDARAIQLLLYYDDVNVCNPLTNKPHKMCLFYYQLANLVPVYRSKLRSIKLFAVCAYKTFKKYKEIAMEKIFEPLVADMKLLGGDDGYTFSIRNVGQVALRGAVLAFLADTPASHAAGGFKEGVGGARRKCRHCMATFETIQKYFEEDLFQLRDQDDHKEQLHDIENAPSQYLKDYFCKEYGINKRSILSNLPYFNVTHQLPQDIMHIFLEGILQYEIKLLLNYLMKTQGVITLDELNHAIKHFPLGYTDAKSRPIVMKHGDLEMKSSTNLGQTASTMWLLSQILPFILQNCVDHTSPQWNSFIMLLEIMGIAFCSEITQASVLYLKSTVKEYLTNFKRTYNVNIIPKQHYLVHLPSQMLAFGPLIRCWCMRFEGKHAYFKDLAKKIRNFKNLPFSLATRNQQMECADFIQMGDNGTDMDNMFSEDIIFGHYKVLRGQSAIDVKNYISRFSGIHLDLDVHSVFECNQIELFGTKYKPGFNNFLLFCLNEAGFPVFGCLKKIWFIEEFGCYFALNVFDTINFEENLNAFRIEEQEIASGYEVVSHAQLKDHHVYHAYKHSNERFIVTRMNILAGV